MDRDVAPARRAGLGRRTGSGSRCRRSTTSSWWPIVRRRCHPGDVARRPPGRWSWTCAKPGPVPMAWPRSGTRRRRPAEAPRSRLHWRRPAHVRRHPTATSPPGARSGARSARGWGDGRNDRGGGSPGSRCAAGVDGLGATGRVGTGGPCPATDRASDSSAAPAADASSGSDWPSRRCWTTWVSSWVRIVRASPVLVDPCQSGRNTSPPAVNALALSWRAASPVSGSRCTLTSSSGAPSTGSSSVRRSAGTPSGARCTRRSATGPQRTGTASWSITGPSPAALRTRTRGCRSGSQRGVGSRVATRRVTASAGPPRAQHHVASRARPTRHRSRRPGVRRGRVPPRARAEQAGVRRGRPPGGGRCRQESPAEARGVGTGR